MRKIDPPKLIRRYYLDWRPVGALPVLDRAGVKRAKLAFQDIVASIHQPEKHKKYNGRREVVPFADAFLEARAVGRNDGFFVAELVFEAAAFRRLIDLDELARIVCLSLKEGLGHTHIYHNLPNRIQPQLLSPANMFRTYPVMLEPNAAHRVIEAGVLSDSYLQSANAWPSARAQAGSQTSPRLAVLHVRRNFFHVYENFSARIVRHRQEMIRYYRSGANRGLALVYGFLLFGALEWRFLLGSIERLLTGAPGALLASIIVAFVTAMATVMTAKVVEGFSQIRGHDLRRIEAISAGHGFFTLADPINTAIDEINVKAGEKVSDFSTIVSALKSSADREQYNVSARMSVLAIYVAAVGLIIATTTGFVSAPDRRSWREDVIQTALQQSMAAAIGSISPKGAVGTGRVDNTP